MGNIEDIGVVGRREPETWQELVLQIVTACGAGEHVFRGEACAYDDPASSSIYRQYKRRAGGAGNGVFSGARQPVHVEMEKVRAARRLYPPNATNAEILTDLRHYGGLTTLVDFSYSLYVALYFACSERPGGREAAGRVFALAVEDLGPPSHDIDYGAGGAHPGMETKLLVPARTGQSRGRTEFQRSVFVHAPRGVIDKKLKRFIKRHWRLCQHPQVARAGAAPCHGASAPLPIRDIALVSRWKSR